MPMPSCSGNRRRSHGSVGRTKQVEQATILEILGAHVKAGRAARLAPSDCQPVVCGKALAYPPLHQI